ncbi:MAG: TonB C-terminal domain-containing protein [Arcobacteraceae bacterium]
MKRVILIALFTTMLSASELESFLSIKDEKTTVPQKVREIYIITAQKENLKIKEDKPNFNSNPTYGDGFKKVQENEALANLKSDIFRNKQEIEKAYTQTEIHHKPIEKIILEHFETPTKYNKYGLKEEVTISFDIDEQNSITNINFIQPSSYEDINERFKEAIMQSSQKLPTPKQKETKTVYYKFDI